MTVDPKKMRMMTVPGPVPVEMGAKSKTWMECQRRRSSDSSQQKLKRGSGKQRMIGPYFNSLQGLGEGA